MRPDGSHELDARMNFMIYGNFTKRTTGKSHHPIYPVHVPTLMHTWPGTPPTSDECQHGKLEKAQIKGATTRPSHSAVRPRSIIESHWFKFLSTSRWNSNICDRAHSPARGLLMVQHRYEATAHVCGEAVLEVRREQRKHLAHAGRFTTVVCAPVQSITSSYPDHIHQSQPHTQTISTKAQLGCLLRPTHL